jgi:hypothetical protein
VWCQKLAPTRDFAERPALDLALQTIPDSAEEEVGARAVPADADYEQLCRDWILGSEEYRRDLLIAADERVGLNQYPRSNAKSANIDVDGARPSSDGGQTLYDLLDLPP